MYPRLKERVMSKETYKLAFVGGAPSSAVGYAHFVASHMDGLWDLQAGVFSRKAAVNRRAADTFGVSEERTYQNLKQLLDTEQGNLDAVVILTPTPLHTEMSIMCLNAGMPVICEKSLSQTSAEAREIQRVCDEKKGFLTVIYNYSGYPMVREMRRMIRDGVFGDIIHFQVEMPQEGFIRTDEHGNKPTPQDWRLKDGAVPTIHLDLAVHLHELIHYLTGLTPLEVIADQSSNGWFDVTDNVICLCRYTQNVQGQVWFSKSALGHRNGLRLRVFGSTASAEWFQLNPEEIQISHVDGRKEIFDRASNAIVSVAARYTRFKAGHPAGFNEALANIYVDIHAALSRYRETGRQESDEVFGAPLSVEGMLWLEAMVRSYQSGQWEKIG